MLQLVVRSQYNGKGSLRGKVEGSSRRQRMIPPALRNSPKFFVQVSSRAEERFRGCCLQETHRRIYTLHETHFLDFYREYWDLYIKEGEVTHHQRPALCCVLVPQRDARTILECRNWGPWKFLGTCHASVLRVELEAMVEAYYYSYHCHQQRRQMMMMNGMAVLNDITNTSTPPTVDSPAFPYHWHLDVYMDSMEDYYGKKYNQRATPATNSAAQRSNDPPSLLRCHSSSSGGRGVARFDRADRRQLVDCSKATAADPGGPFWGFAWVGGGGSGTSKKLGTKLDAACITYQNSHSTAAAAATAAIDDDDNKNSNHNDVNDEVVAMMQSTEDWPQLTGK